MCMAEGRLHLMDPQTFEQEEVAADMFGSAAAFLVPGTTITLNIAPDGKAVSGTRHAFSRLLTSWLWRALKSRKTPQ